MTTMDGDQYNLYGGEPPHARGSDTSYAAAKAIEQSAETIRGRVYRYIQAMDGATDDEVEWALNLRHQTASARRRELVLLGLVVDSSWRRPTRSGTNATIWVAKELEKGE